MKLTDKQRKEFEELARPLMDWLGDPENCHPHVHAVLDSGRAELSEGVCAFTTEDYIRD